MITALLLASSSASFVAPFSARPISNAPLRARPNIVAQEVFPERDLEKLEQAQSSSERNMKMAKLVGELAELADAAGNANADGCDTPTTAMIALLQEARPMLLQPFEGSPEPGSVYGDAGAPI